MAATKEVKGSWVAVTGTPGEVAQALSDEKVMVHQSIGLASHTSYKIVVLYSKGLTS